MNQPNTIIKAGYRLSVTSWENDGDHYNTVTLDGLDLDTVKFYVELVKCFNSRNNHIKPGIGNYYDPDSDELARVYSILGPVGLKHIDTIVKLGNQNFSQDSTEEDLANLLLDMSYDLGLRNGEFFTRVLEEFKVEYVPRDIVLWNVTGDFE